LSIVATFPGNTGLERALHRKLKDSHIRGEWFKRTPEVDAAIAELKGSPVTTNHDGGDPVSRLSDWIARSGMTCKEFATRAQVTPGALSRIFERRSTPRLATIFQIQEATGGEICSYCWAQNPLDAHLHSHARHLTAPSPAASVAASASPSVSSNKPSGTF
jgi:DNA-binding phage protein